MQEPPIFKGKVTNIGGAGVIYYKGIPEKDVRAALVFSERLNILQQPEFTDKDMATGLLTDSKLGQVYVTSLYCHDKRPAVPSLFKKLVRRAIKEKRQLLVLSDTNSWSPSLWGGKQGNTRGRTWETYLESINHAIQVYFKVSFLGYVNAPVMCILKVL